MKREFKVNLSVELPLDSRSPSGTNVPPPPTGGVFPSRGAFGKEISLFVDCQGLSYKERWHPEGMTERLDKKNAERRTDDQSDLQ